MRAEAEDGIYEAEDGRANHFEDFGRPRGGARDYVPRSPQRVFLLPPGTPWHVPLQLGTVSWRARSRPHGLREAPTEPNWKGRFLLPLLG